MRYVLGTLAVLAAISVGGAGAAAPAVGCGSVITTSVTLTADLRGCDNGLAIAAAGVTVDLGGHQIVGHSADAGVGIWIQADDATIRNGTVSGFGQGIYSGGLPKGVRVLNTTVQRNGNGILLLDAERADVSNNRVVDNTGRGVFLYRSYPSIVSANLVARNGGDGIDVDSSHATVTGNSVSFNTGDGISVSDDVCGHLNLFRVGNNTANSNTALGINVLQSPKCLPGTDPYDQLDAGGNSAKGNGDLRQCVIVVCDGKRARV